MAMVLGHNDDHCIVVYKAADPGTEISRQREASSSSSSPSRHHVLMSTMTKGTRMSPMLPTSSNDPPSRKKSKDVEGIPLSRKAFRKFSRGDVELARLTSKSFRVFFFKKSSLLRFDVALFDERALSLSLSLSLSLCGEKRVGCFLFAG